MILKYYHTLKYLKAVQIYGRIYSKLKKPFSVYYLPALKSTPAGINNKAPFIKHDPWNSSENIINNNFTFLNEAHSFGNNINWQDKTLPLLWMFNLNYFGYLYLLNKTDQEKIVNDWIKNNSTGSQPGWHPYSTSLRIVNWIKSDIKDELIQKSLFEQASYLYRNMEFYHPANHYLENAKALIFAGVFFNGDYNAKKWYQIGVSIYRKHLPKMILNDGCFFELSPMYHLIILEGILDILNIIGKETTEYKLFKEYAEKMLGFLPTITHPDGELVLFNDSTIEIAPAPASINNYAASLGIESKTEAADRKNESGLFSFNNKDIFIIIDGGSIEPDHIPAHAHADTFSYELSYISKKFVVDSGVYEYSAGEMRDYCRSTSAHNTVTIDRVSQAEMWGSFRVARRYDPIDVKFINNGGGFLFEGKFDGYSKLIGDDLVHQRKIELETNNDIISIEDKITGSRKHLVEGFIHLHPAVIINLIADHMVLSRDHIVLKLVITGCKFSIDDGWYCPEFGKKIPNKVIRLYAEALPVKFKYHFQIQ